MCGKPPALGIGAASFFVFHKKDIADSPTAPEKLRWNAQIFLVFEFVYLKSLKGMFVSSHFQMENLYTYISGLTERVEKLVKTQSELVIENSNLKSRNEELERMITDQKNVLVKLEEQNKVVKIAKAVTDDDDDRKGQRKRLNELVREVDKCIALLNN